MDILRISRHPELLPQAAAWFHGKWGIPLSAYEESREEAGLALQACGIPWPPWTPSRRSASW